MPHGTRCIRPYRHAENHEEIESYRVDSSSGRRSVGPRPGARNYVRRHNGPIAGAHFGDEMTPVGGADNCAAERHDSVDALPIENDVIARRKKPFESVAKTDDLPTEFFRSEHNSAQHRVQSRAITTTGQDSNPRFHFCNSAIRASF